MGLCEYCGAQAGFMRRSHRACVELFEQGIKGIETVVADSALSQEDAVTRVQELAQSHGVVGEHLTAALEEAWADCIKISLQGRALSTTEEVRLDNLLGAFGLNNLKAERHRIWSRVLQCRQTAASETIEGLVYRGLQLATAASTDDAASESRLAQVEAKIRLAAQAANIQESALHGLVVQSMEGALEQLLEDGHLSHSEERAVGAVLAMFDIRGGTHDGNSIWAKMVKFAALRDLAEGTLPTPFVDVRVPFRMMKSEALIWLFEGVDYSLTRTRREFRGGSVGVNVRVARGVYLRQSSFRGRPVEVNESVQVDTGLLGITTKHIYFTGPSRSFRIRHNKIVSLTPFSDGVGLTRDSATARPEFFRVGDGWFVYNLLQNIEVT